VDETNLQVTSNLMLDDDRHRPEHRFFPGDYVAIVNRTLADSRVIDSNLTPNQIIEYKQYIPCLICGKTCAGTCESLRG
jgi:hypothetical protein